MVRLAQTLGPTNSASCAIHDVEISIAKPTAMPYTASMRTVAETDIFIKCAADNWNDLERNEFISWIAANPEAGDVIPGSGGCRKLRWSRQGTGKRGGARVIYFLGHETAIWLLIVYIKSKFDNLPAAFLAKLKTEVEHAIRN